MQLDILPWHWIVVVAVALDLVALGSIWTSRVHSVKAKLAWTFAVAALPILGALAWFPLGWERRRHR